MCLSKVWRTVQIWSKLDKDFGQGTAEDLHTKSYRLLNTQTMN